MADRPLAANVTDVSFNLSQPCLLLRKLALRPLRRRKVQVESSLQWLRLVYLLPNAVRTLLT